MGKTCSSPHRLIAENSSQSAIFWRRVTSGSRGFGSARRSDLQAREVLPIQCGHDNVSWPLFCRAVFVIRTKPTVPGLMSRGHARSFQRRLQIADDVALRAMGGYGLGWLRREAGHAKCSDPRDRLYGLLGLLPEHDRAGIVPDYMRPVCRYLRRGDPQPDTACRSPGYHQRLRARRASICHRPAELGP